MSRLLLRALFAVNQAAARVFSPGRVARDGVPASAIFGEGSNGGGLPGRPGSVPRLSPIRKDEGQQGVPPELLRKIRQIEIRTRRLVSETLAGQYHSAFKGQGMDFDEVREYQPGDEVRTIDWNVTARMNHPFVKKFREERELTVILAVDLSGSGRFGSGDKSKRELMAEVASVLAFSAIRNQDKVGLLLFTEVVEKFIPPAKGRRHVLRVVRDILFHSPQFPGTNTNGALEFLGRVLPHRSVVVMLSDFLGETRPGRALIEAHLKRKALQSETLGRLSQTTLSQVSRRHDLIALQVVDPREQDLPAVGRLMLQDAETGEVVEINTTDPRRLQAFSVRQQKAQGELERLFRGSRIDHLRLVVPAPGAADDAYMGELAAFFEGRRKRRSQ
jgi:uncharacterized protein (DUF58 family)